MAKESSHKELTADETLTASNPPLLNDLLTSSPDTTFTQKVITFSKENMFFIIVIALGIFLRWYQLDDRPMHHDESLFAIYGRYFYVNPEHQFYHYDPLLNGPLLFHLLPIIYHLFGPTEWAARVIPAVIGSFFIFLPFFFRRYFSKQTLFFLVSFIAFSPNFVYWSRFLRHEYLVLAAMMMMIWGVAMSKGARKAFWVLLGLTLQFCIKENVFVTVIMLVAYLLFELVFNTIFVTHAKSSLLMDTVRYVKRHPIATILALMVSLAILAYLYGAGFAQSGNNFFRHAAGIRDFFYGRGIAYWWNQHSIERISGPFCFTFLILAWYDILFVLAVFWHMIHFYRKASMPYLVAILTAFLVAFVCHIVNAGADLPSISFYKFFKFKIHIDLYLFLLVITHAINVVVFHLRHYQKYLAWWGFACYATLFAYCYAGERVPWLAIYPLFFGVIYLAFYFQSTGITNWCFTHRWRQLPGLHWLRARPGKSLAFALLIFVMAFNGYKTLMTCFTRGGSVSFTPQTEPMSQVHTTRMYKNIILEIRRRMIDPLDGHKVRVLSQGEGWPISWYLYGLPEYLFIRNKEPLRNFDYIFYNRDARDVPAELRDIRQFNRIIVPLRDWWVPDYKTMTPWKFLVYILIHKPWNPSGSTDVIMYTPIRYAPLIVPPPEPPATNPPSNP